MSTAWKIPFDTAVTVWFAVLAIKGKKKKKSVLGGQGVQAGYELRLFFKVKDLNFHFPLPLGLIRV